MKTAIGKLRRSALAGTWFFGALSLVGSLAGCSGGTSSLPPSPARFAGHYVGSFMATYDPRAPISGTVSGPLDFTVAQSGAVTLTNPYPFPPDPANLTGTGTVDAQGAMTASVGTSFFGIRSLTGQLHVNADGRVTGEGAITVLASSEVAYGTWQATLQPSP